MNVAVRSLFLAGGLVFASLHTTPAAAPPEPFKLTSPAFADNAPLDKKFAGDRKDNPNCVGQSISPPLEWTNPPAGTNSFALLLTDPRAAADWAWYIWCIRHPCRGDRLCEGELSKPSDKFVGGKSTMGLPTYFGPCTPAGDWHHYTFILIATISIRRRYSRDDARRVVHRARRPYQDSVGLIGRFRHPE